MRTRTRTASSRAAQTRSPFVSIRRFARARLTQRRKLPERRKLRPSPSRSPPQAGTQCQRNRIHSFTGATEGCFVPDKKPRKAVQQSSASCDSNQQSTAQSRLGACVISGWSASRFRRGAGGRSPAPHARFGGAAPGGCFRFTRCTFTKSAEGRGGGVPRARPGSQCWWPASECGQPPPLCGWPPRTQCWTRARSQAQQQGGSPTVRFEGSGLPGVYYKMLSFPSVTASVTKPLFKE